MGVVAHGAPVFKIGGDPGGISTRAAVMMARADEFGNIHSGLSSLSADGWEGRAADHFRSKFKVQIKGWVDAQEAFSSASEAYSSYASTLASAQSQCDGIRSRWKQGRDAVQQAQNNQADARSQAAADGGSPMFDASCDEGPGRSQMAAAEADFQTLVDQVNEAGDLLITALNAGIAKLPERTWWDSVKRTFTSVVVGAVEAVVDLAKLLWKLGGGEAWVDFGRILMGDMTWDEYVIKHYEIPAETIVGMAKALWNDPVGFMKSVGKSLLDWDTWTDDPARAIGHLLPDVIMAVVTMGGSAGVSAGEKALTGTARALRIGKEVFKAILPISPDDIRSLAKLGKNMVGKLSAHGLNTAADVADLANTAKHLAGAADHAHDAAHAANGMAGALDGVGDVGRAARSGGALGDTSHAAHAVGGAADAAGSASHATHAAAGGGGIASSASGAGHAASGGGGFASGASHAANGAGGASHGVSSAADAAGSASHATHAGGNAAGAAGSASHATHAGGNAADAAGNASHATHAGGNAADAAGNASHATHGGGDVKDSALPPTEPGHRSNGVSSAAQPATTPHAPAAGDAGGHAAPAAPAPSASHGAHNNAFMNADTGGATHGAGNAAAPGTSGHTGAPAAGSHGAPATGAPTSGAHGAPATGAPASGAHGAPATGAPAAGTHGAPATSAPATGAPAAGTHGAPATSAPATGAPAAGSHGGASGHGAAGGAPAAPVRSNGVGERGAPAEAIAQKKPADPDKIVTRSGNDFGTPANKIDTHAGGNQKSLDHVDFKPGDSDKVPNGQYHPVETAGGARRGGTDGAPTGDNFAPQPAAAGSGKSPGKSNSSWDSDGFSANRDDYDLFGVENRKDSSYLDYSPTHANGETRGADELVGAGVGRSEASVGAQGSYERAGAFGGSDPSRVSHGADGFGSTADFGANAGHAGHGANGITNSADVGGGVGDASRGTHAAGAPTGQGGGHVGADTGTHGGSSAPAQDPHRADPGMSTGDTHGVSRADSTPGHGDTPRAGHGGDGAPDAPTTPKKDTPAGDSLGGDKQPHSGKHAADTPATHADEAADARKAGHDSGDANGSGKADADAKHGHDSVEHADADPKAKDHSANGKADDTADSAHHGDKTEAAKATPDAPEKSSYDKMAEDLGGEPPKPAKTTPDGPQTREEFAKVLDDNYEANHAAKATPDAPEKSPNDDMIEKHSGDTQPHGEKHAADTPTTHADDAADTRKAGHGSSDAHGSGKADADAQHGHDSGEHADADPKAKDHSANGKADDAADSARHGDKTEADKPTSDKSHKEDDAAHHDGDEHPKDTDDKHSAKNDDANSKSTKDEADTHKSDKDGDGKSDKESDGKSDKESDAKSDKDGDGKSDKDDADGKSDKDDADGSGDTTPSTDASGSSSNSDDLLDESIFDSSPDTREYIQRPISDEPYLKDKPEMFEEPTTVQELAERSPGPTSDPYANLPEEDKKIWTAGLGDRFETGADIYVNPRAQLSEGTNPEIRTTADMMRSNLTKPGSTESVWRNDIEHGAIPGTDRYYTNLAEFKEDFTITGFDRTSTPGGGFLSPIIDGAIVPGENRATSLYNLNCRYHQYELTDKELKAGHRLEISLAAPEQNSPGGAPQIRILKEVNGKEVQMSVAEMIKEGYLKGRSEHTGTVQELNREDLVRRFNNSRGSRK